MARFWLKTYKNRIFKTFWAVIRAKNLTLPDKNLITVRTNQEIKDYLKFVVPSDEGNEYAIIQYCLSNFDLKIKFKKLEPDGHAPTVTFEQFRKWIEREYISANSFIAIISGPYSGVTGIISSVKNDSLILGAALMKTGDLVTDKISIPFKSEIRQATEEEQENILHSLSLEGLEWNNDFNRVTERFVPRECNYIRFRSKVSKKGGIGVFRAFSEDGCVIMYCVKLENEPMRHSLKDNIGRQEEYDFFVATEIERKNFKIELAKSGKAWNGYLKRIEPIDFRVNKGEYYYFINDKFSPSRAQDSYSTQDKLKFNSGNYFRSLEEIEEMIDLISEFRKEQLARPRKKD